jgi:peptidoglycan hydrolase CwlO-like protein
MKFKILFVLLLVPFLFISCDKQKINQLNEQVAQLQAENEQLKQENDEIKMYVEQIARLIESIDKDIESIIETEADIRELSEDLKTGKAPGAAKLEGEIKNKLGQIGRFILDSKDRISDLEKRLATSKQDIQGLKSMVANLKTKLEAKENEVAALMQEIGVLETDIVRLGDEIKEKDIKIADQETIIEEQNKRYYIIDKQKALAEKGIIRKEGGFLGIGRTVKLSPNLDTQYFSVIDFETDLEIGIPFKPDKIKIISPHPINAYELMSAGDQAILKILNPGQFWQATKCLVIAVK